MHTNLSDNNRDTGFDSVTAKKGLVVCLGWIPAGLVSKAYKTTWNGEVVEKLEIDEEMAFGQNYIDSNTKFKVVFNEEYDEDFDEFSHSHLPFSDLLKVSGYLRKEEKKDVMSGRWNNEFSA